MPNYLDEAGLTRFWNDIRSQIGHATDDQVYAWLNDHPEATTTVEDGAVTTDKLANGAVTNAKLANGAGYQCKVTYNQTTDLDTLLTPGVYTMQYSTQYGDVDPSFPDGWGVGTLVVFSNRAASIKYQMYVYHASGKIFTRYYTASNETFTAWSRDIPPEFTQEMAFTAPVADENYTGDQASNLDALTTPGIYVFTYNSSLGGAGMHSSWPSMPKTNPVSILIVSKGASTVIFQTLITMYYGFTYTRIKASGSWREWESDAIDKEISILFIGNSLTQDAISYVPWILRHFFPQIRFRFYIYYNGGYTLAQQLAQMQADDPCAIFSEIENNYSWVNTNNSVKMSDICSNYTFDLVCLQEYFNYKTEYTSTDIDTYNAIIDHINGLYSSEYHMLEYVTLFHAPKRGANMDSIYALTKQGISDILSQTMTTDCIPAGISIYDACHTSLNSLGDDGGLSPDGTHAQEGLPCVMQAFTTIMWLFDRMAVNKGIFGTNWRISSTQYNNMNVPGPNLGNGLIRGTAAQNALMQKVAIMAYNKGKGLVSKAHEAWLA